MCVRDGCRHHQVAQDTSKLGTRRPPRGRKQPSRQNRIRPTHTSHRDTKTWLTLGGWNPGRCVFLKIGWGGGTKPIHINESAQARATHKATANTNSNKKRQNRLNQKTTAEGRVRTRHLRIVKHLELLIRGRSNSVSDSYLQRSVSNSVSDTVSDSVRNNNIVAITLRHSGHASLTRPFLRRSKR